MESLGRRVFAEFLGTFWLVFGGTGSAVFAAVFLTDAHVPVGIGFAGVALAFGLTVLTMAYAIGHVSGCHLKSFSTTFKHAAIPPQRQFRWRWLRHSSKACYDADN